MQLLNLRVTFQSHIRFARKVQKYGDAISKYTYLTSLNDILVIITYDCEESILLTNLHIYVVWLEA